MPNLKEFIERILHPDHNDNRKKSEEVNQGTASTVVEQQGLESPKERIKQVYCVEPAEVAEPDTVIHINDSLVRSDSNASSYFVDVPEPVPDTPSDAYSDGDYATPLDGDYATPLDGDYATPLDGDYATPLTPVTPREEFEESMEDQEPIGKEKQVNGEEQIASEESPITEGSPSKKPVHVAESEEKVKEVFEDIEKISEGMELIVDETRSEDENGGEEEKTLAAQIIDENPDVNPADVFVAIKRLGDFAECSVSEAVQELRTDKETGEMLPEARKERSDTMESYGLTYDDEFGSDSSDERTTTGSSKPPEDREAAAEDSSMLLRKWSKGVEPNTLEDLPEADQSPDWRQRERKSTATKGQLEKPVGLTKVELTRTEIHPSILSEINSEFVDKFLELPIIDTGLNYAYLLYTSVKGTCPDLVQRLLFDSTERSALVALQITKWLLKPFTGQLRTIDHLAAQTLVAIEDRLLPQAS